MRDRGGISRGTGLLNSRWTIMVNWKGRGPLETVCFIRPIPRTKMRLSWWQPISISTTFFHKKLSSFSPITWSTLVRSKTIFRLFLWLKEKGYYLLQSTHMKVHSRTVCRMVMVITVQRWCRWWGSLGTGSLGESVYRRHRVSCLLVGLCRMWRGRVIW